MNIRLTVKIILNKDLTLRKNAKFSQGFMDYLKLKYQKNSRNILFMIQ